MKTTDIGHLKETDWAYLSECADRFEKTWKDNPDGADVGACLPPPEHPMRKFVLRELVKIDLEYRWRRGAGMKIEQYLEKYDDLKSRGDVPTTLILEEYRVRRLYGDKPPLAVYRTRFPDQFAELETLVDQCTASDPEQTVARPSARTAVPDVPSETTGTEVGHGYRLIERIGSGGFGEVWRAEAPGGFGAAVKILFRAIDHEDALREMQSLLLIKQLRHPFLLQTQAYFFHENRLYIVMELADGSLRDRLRECQKNQMQGIPVAELISYFREAAEALDYLHSEKVLHRDIKPDNILVLKGHTKVADFGLARLQEQSEHMASATGSGTPAYMAPEMWGSKVSEHTDQYCLAVSYAELRLGRRLFVGRDLLALMTEHLNSTPDLEPLPKDEQEVLLKALAKKPDERHPSCLAFAQALEQSLAAELATSGFRPAHFSTALKLEDVKTAHLDSSAPSREGGDSMRTLTGAGLGEQPAPLRTDVLPRTAHTREKTWQETPGSEPRAKRSPLFWVVASAIGVVFLVAVVALFLGQQEPSSDRPGGSAEPEVDYLPPHTEKSAGARIVVLELEGNKKLYDRIDYLLEDGSRVPFVLVPRKQSKDPRTFYIMENKVSNSQFAAFMQSPRSAALLDEQSKGKKWVLRGEWKKGGLAVEKVIEKNIEKEIEKDIGVSNGKLPVLRVTVTEAYCFALWIGGDLPEAVQWDMAAGRFLKNARPGPFDPSWHKDEKDTIAIDRYDAGPMPVGAANKDVSPFGCRDMSGNGMEWTGTPSSLIGRVPLNSPKKETAIILRGHGYRDDTPLTFLDKKSEVAAYGSPSFDIGFRVVLERP